MFLDPNRVQRWIILVMTISLKPLFEAINQVDSEHDMTQIVLPIGEYFTAKRCAIFFSTNFLLQITIFRKY